MAGPGGHGPAIRPGQLTAVPEILGATVTDRDWFRALGPGVYLSPGRAAPDLLRVPVGDAQRILRQTARVVADTPRDGSGDLVWVAGASELLVRLDGLNLTCGVGLVTVGIPVGCDQLPGPATVTVPIGVGTQDAPSGLVMSTLDKPVGPAVVVDRWADPLVGFAWAALVHLAQSLCAAAGRDATGAPLLPGYLGSGLDVLLVQPMAGHREAGAPRADPRARPGVVLAGPNLAVPEPRLLVPPIATLRAVAPVAQRHDDPGPPR
jgi:hypothetical protein